MKLLLKPGKIFRISDGCPGFNYSATAAVVHGGSANGLLAWKSMDGKTLKEIEAL